MQFTITTIYLWRRQNSCFFENNRFCDSEQQQEFNHVSRIISFIIVFAKTVGKMHIAHVLTAFRIKFIIPRQRLLFRTMPRHAQRIAMALAYATCANFHLKLPIDVFFSLLSYPVKLIKMDNSVCARL